MHCARPGCTGVQMTGWFKKPVASIGDLKSLKMRIPGLAFRGLSGEDLIGEFMGLIPGGV